MKLLKLATLLFAVVLLAPTWRHDSNAPRPFPGAWGKNVKATRGAFATYNTSLPIVLSVETLVDEDDACTGTPNVDEYCGLCESVGNSTCSLREVLLDTRPVFGVCNVAGTILLNDPIRIGERVYARIDHGWETLAQQGYRRMRQLFLGRFNNA